MSISIKNLFLFCLFALCGQALSAQSGEASYQGYRLHVTNIEVLKNSGDNWKIKFTAINTGREDIHFGKGIAAAPPVLIRFDQSLEKQNLADYRSDIEYELMAEKVSYPAGKVFPGRELSFSTAEVFTARGPKVSEPVQRAEVEETKVQAVEEVVPPATEEVAGCADLQLEKVRVVKKGKRWAVIEYTVTNYGTRLAKLTGPDRKDDDNVGIRISASTSEKITRSSMILGGEFVKEKQADLRPRDSFTGLMRIDISQLTKYNPYLVLELDAYDTVDECDETNNRGAVRVK